MASGLNSQHFAGPSAPEPLRRFQAKPSFENLADAIIFAVDSNIPAQRFSMVEHQIEKAVAESTKSVADDVNKIVAKGYTSTMADELAECHAPFVKFFDFLSSLYAVEPQGGIGKASPDMDVCDHPNGETRQSESPNEVISELRSVLYEMEAQFSTIEEFFRDRKALGWYPNAYFFMKSFGDIEEGSAIADDIDNLLPMFLQEPHYSKPRSRYIHKETLSRWEPVIRKVASVMLCNDSEKVLLGLTLDSAFQKRDLLMDIEGDASQGIAIFAAIARSGEDYSKLFVRRLIELSDETARDGGGIELNPILSAALLTIFEPSPIDGAWLSADAISDLLSKIDNLRELLARIYPAKEDVRKRALEEAPKGAYIEKVPMPSSISIDDIILLMRSPDYDETLFEMFIHGLQENFDSLTRDASGDFRMPWSRRAAKRVGFFMACHGGWALEKLQKICPAAPLMFFSNEPGSDYLPMDFAFDIVDIDGEPIARHPRAISELVKFLIDESWPKLACALLAYHLIMHTIEKRSLQGLNRWSEGIRACSGLHGSEHVTFALKVLSIAAPDQRTREWAGQFLPKEEPNSSSGVPLAKERFEEKIEAGSRAYAQRQLIHLIDDESAFFALHQDTQNWLLDFEIRWRSAQPDFGSGEFSGWGSLAVDMWKPFENELEKRLAPIWRGEAGDQARRFLQATKGYSVPRKPHIGHYLDMILERSPPKAVQLAFKECNVDLEQLRSIAKTFAQIKNLRNKGAHASKVTEEELVRYRTKLIRGGMLRDFVLAVTAGDRVQNGH